MQVASFLVNDDILKDELSGVTENKGRYQHFGLGTLRQLHATSIGICLRWPSV